MRRFKPSNLREQVAEELAHQRGFESAAMIRKHLPAADKVLTIVRTAVENEAGTMGYALRDETGWQPAIAEMMDRIGAPPSDRDGARR